MTPVIGKLTRAMVLLQNENRIESHNLIHFKSSQWKPGDDYHKTVWYPVSYCNGSFAPTTAPNFDLVNALQGCPEEYHAETVYEAGDQVSVVSSSAVVVFECKRWPESTYCNAGLSFAPNTKYGEIG